MKIFGKELFKKATQGNQLHYSAVELMDKSEYLPDFYKDFGGSGTPIIQFLDGSGTVSAVGHSTSVNGWTNVPVMEPTKKDIKKEDKPEAERVTPKGIFKMQMLNDKNFVMKADPAYVEEQIESFKNRLSLLKADDFDMRRGVTEVYSILMRLENRKRYKEFEHFFNEYPYTVTTKIQALLDDKKNDHLKMGMVSQFVPDLPKEAIDAIKQYERVTKEICKKKPVFYIIGNKKDFERTNKRKDPILLAQSPFGHVWQILGAWDEEMLLLEEL